MAMVSRTCPCTCPYPRPAFALPLARCTCTHARRPFGAESPHGVNHVNVRAVNCAPNTLHPGWVHCRSWLQAWKLQILRTAIAKNGSVRRRR